MLVLVVVAVGFASAHLARSQEATEEQQAVLYHSPEERRELAGITLLEGVTVGTLLEVEAFVGRENGESVSDVVLATFELGINAELNELVKGRALLLWEEDDTEPIDLDEATITLGGSDRIPVYLTAGRMYVPFGVFSSHFISDPLVLELGETRESAILAGYGNSMVEVQAAVFNGDLHEGNDGINNVVASATVTPVDGVRFGGFWISDIGESDVLQELAEGRFEEADPAVHEEVHGVGAFLHAEVWKLALDVEYITATKDFASGLFGDEALCPAAWNAELAFHSGARWEIAAKAEGSDDFPEFPETQCGVAGSVAITDSATLAVEFLHGEYEGETPDRNMATCQFALEF